MAVLDRQKSDILRYFGGCMRDIVVTSALYYANGPIHLGHLVECIQADVWVRHQRMGGHRCLFIGGDDAHGTAIMLSAEKEQIAAEALIKRVYDEHILDFKAFHIGFDHYHTTHSDENRALCEQFYARMQATGDITRRVIQQAFDPVKAIFLPDRFIRGTCPHCQAVHQYGDNCEVCGATYTPMELIDPISTLSGMTPIEKESEHYFFNPGHYQAFLADWIDSGSVQPAIAHKLKEWFAEPLRPWDISRDAPYFGFEIPDAPGKYFYVWLDAPIGYWASLKHFCTQHDAYDFDHYINPNTKTELYHFIGKDIVYFHAIFWPAMLKSAQFRLPTQIFVHGYLTIDGKKMSKSRGTFITAREYINHLDPEYLRYYFCAKLGSQVEDIDLNLDDFMHRVNADLVGKFINLASRCAGFITKYFDGILSDYLQDPLLFQNFVDEKTEIFPAFEQLHYNKAVRLIMALADRANQYIDQQKPWQLAKQEEQRELLHAVCTQGINLFKVLATYLSPILPVTSEKIILFLNTEPLTWVNIVTPLLNHRIRPFQPLMQRITQEALDQLQHERLKYCPPL